MILITGATGHVGNTLVQSLMKSGEKLRLFLPPNERVEALDGAEFELFVGDLRNPADVNRAVKDVDYVYHLAGIVDISPNNLTLLEEVNVRGTRNIVEACLMNRVKRLVYCSSVHAIPEPPKGVVIKEAAREDFPDDTLLGPYAVSKSKATNEVYSGIEKGLDAVIIFPSGIIGPGDFRGSEMGKVFEYLLGKSRASVYACFSGEYNFVDVRDVVKALRQAMKHGRSGQGYLLSGHTITIPELFTYVARWTGQKAIKLVLLPLWLVKSASYIVQFFSRVFNKKSFFMPYSIDVLDSNCEMDSSKAERELGFQPRPLEETLQNTLSWLIARNPRFREIIEKRNFKQRKRRHRSA